MEYGTWTGIFFEGNFEGNNHNITIDSLTKTDTYKSSGLFGMASGGTISNLTVGGNLDAPVENIGGIAGAIKDGKILNCTNNCKVTNTTKRWHGGIAGVIRNAIIEDCTNTETIKGASRVGGIVGQAENNSRVTNCTNSDSAWIMCHETDILEYDSYSFGVAGGICGNLMGSSTIENCTNMGKVSEGTNVNLPNGIVAGGIAGWVYYNSSIIKSKNKGMVCYSSTTIPYAGALGGISGAICSNSLIDQCFNDATITSNSKMNQIGGIVGSVIVGSTVQNTYNKKEISGKAYVGGIIGMSQNDTGKNYVYNSYNATTSISGSTNVGNFIGYSANIEGKYLAWVDQIEPVGIYAGSNYTYSNTGGITITEMKTLNSKLLTLLQNENGRGLWSQDPNINDGLPYLVNNVP